MMTREEALDLLHEYTKGEGLRRHALAVEAAMRAYARRLGEDEEAWGLIGLLHDFDYERYPEAPDHPVKGGEILRDHGLPEALRTVILSHAPYTGVPRETAMARHLFACDELCGLITACSLVRPNGISDLRAKSVKKKMKDKGFARSVSRDDIRTGAEAAGLDLTEHIEFVIEAMRGISEALGL